MARPLPKDLEERIGNAAKKSEIRSVGIFAFGAGTIFGFALGAAVFRTVGGSFFFMFGAGVVGILWYLAASRKKKK